MTIFPLFQGTTNSPKTSSRTPSANVPATVTITADAAKTEAPKTYSSDLLGLSTPVNGPPDTNNASLDNDIFGFFMSAAPAATGMQASAAAAPLPASGSAKAGAGESSLAQQEQDFFNQVGGAIDNDKGKMTKDSILALYGAAPTMSRAPPVNNQFMAQGIPQLNDDFARLTTQFPAQPQPQQPAAAFGALMNNGNSFDHFGLMQPAGQPSTLNFQPTINSAMPNQRSGAFPNLMQAGPTPFVRADFK